MVKFASPSCVRFISFGFLLATTCVWVWMVCSLHSVTTGSRDRANVPLIIIIIIIPVLCSSVICFHVKPATPISSTASTLPCKNHPPRDVPLHLWTKPTERSPTITLVRSIDPPSYTSESIEGIWTRGRR